MDIGRRGLRALPPRGSRESQTSQNGVPEANRSPLAEVFVGRQPIFDTRQRAIGYELLFRDGQADSAVVIDQERATTTVVLNSITEIGFEQIVGGRPAWINVSTGFMRNGLAQLLPPAPLVLEILENQAIDDEIIAKVTELKRRGHRFALDDFLYTPDTERQLAFADFVKLDLLALGRDELSKIVTRLEDHMEVSSDLAANHGRSPTRSWD